MATDQIDAFTVRVSTYRISDIKRANNLMTNQDFYGLKHLKIPVKKFSLLTEILPSAPETTPFASNTVEESESDTRIIPIGIGTAGRCPSPQDSAAFFKRMDEDLVKIMLSTNSQKESLEAAAVALTTPQIHPLVKDAVDCQWNYLVVIILVVAIVIPLLLYLYMRSSHDHHEVVYPSTSTSESVSVDRPS